MKLIIGLGNPGKDYQNTRHNVGFLVLDAYLNTSDWKEKFNALYHEERINGEKVIFVKPLTYMNLSGDCVIKYVKYFDISIEDILIIQDDLDLPYMQYRLKFDSSAGGHNGIKSIINNLGTQKIPRLKIGIAHDRSVDTKDYVLGHFNKDDLKLFENKTQIFNNIINDFISQDINYCMANYNRR